MDVFELGPVTNPAYLTTQASLRSLPECLADTAPAPIDHIRSYPALVRATLRGTL